VPRSGESGPEARGPIALLGGLLLRQGDRDLVEFGGVVEDQLVEGRFAERRLAGSVAHRLRIGPRAVEAGEVAGPQEVLVADLGTRRKPPSSSTSKVKKRCSLTISLGRRFSAMSGLKTRLSASPNSYSRSKRQNMNGTQPTPLLQGRSARRGGVADAGENDRAHQLGHRPHREVGDPHQGLVARFEPGTPTPIWRVPPLG